MSAYYKFPFSHPTEQDQVKDGFKSVNTAEKIKEMFGFLIFISIILVVLYFTVGNLIFVPALIVGMVIYAFGALFIFSGIQRLVRISPVVDAFRRKITLEVLLPNFYPALQELNAHEGAYSDAQKEVLGDLMFDIKETTFWYHDKLRNLLKGVISPGERAVDLDIQEALNNDELRELEKKYFDAFVAFASCANQVYESAGLNGNREDPLFLMAKH